ncbi:M28 family metallopeptidase [Candidatus Latescibacterota bacterium]
MNKKCTVFSVVFAVVISLPCFGEEMNMGELLQTISREVSGNRARDYTMRLWQYEKWSTLPMWQKSAQECRTIMLERGLNEAEVVDTPADGVTQYGTWTNPIGWDVKQATLEVIEPSNLPDEYRFLCNYLDNPTSLNNFSCPTPQEGVEAELVLLERSTKEAIESVDVRGKIILVPSGSRRMKRHLDPNGALGIVSDEIEGQNRDLITANQWLNGWNEVPGGWLMNASDSRKNFGFSISQKKANYLRNLMRRGVTVKVRAKVDSKYFTDDSLPYVTGCLHGTEPEGQEVLIGGHMFEWGANDNATGCAAIMESVCTIGDLIREGKLPRPRRNIRIWMGHEMFGSMAFAEHNIDRLHRTIASVNCDTPAGDYEHYRTALSISMNFNYSPSCTDAIFPEMVRQYYDTYSPYKLWQTLPFRGGQDNFWGEPMVGVPLNAISYKSWGHLHHNSLDTIDKVDPRTLEELSLLNASYLYYMANADYDDVSYIADLTYDHSVKVILGKTREMKNRLANAGDGSALGRQLAEGVKVISYYAGLQKQAMSGIIRLVPEENRDAAEKVLSLYLKEIETFSESMVDSFEKAGKDRARSESIKIARFKPVIGDWEREAETIIPLRTKIGTLTLDGIPIEEWKEATSSPRWWSPRNWATSSYWWCDGKRNLNEVKDLVELQAGGPIRDFDLIEFFRFLEKYDLVEFVE